MTEEVRTMFDIGLASNNEKKIIYFLEKLYKIPFSKPEKWEQEIFDFFREINIVPYIIETSLDEEMETMKDIIKNTFFKTIIGYRVIHLSTNKIYEDLIKIYEGIKNGKKIVDCIEYLFATNHHLKKMMVKNTDNEDTRFKEFGVAIHPGSCELIKDNKVIGYEKIYFILPDKDIEYPLKDWAKEISTNWRMKLNKKLNPKKNNSKKRDPIETRLRHEVFKRDSYKCVECGKSNKDTTLHADHILPVSQGGVDELSNLQTLCQACNLSKSNRKWEGGLVK